MAGLSSIEKKWQKLWSKAGVFEPDLKKSKKPFYNLMMFPYPSAEGLHIGNMYAFVGSDIYGRFKRMQGHDVFEPIGLDGFGIHSENYALKIKKHPMKLAKISEKNFYRQLEMIGNGFAWKEKLETYDPEYYKWTQWIFVQMFKKGLAYRKKQAVNWCPNCKTVLADEQVISGECERCQSKVLKKELEQWFFKITNYAERLLRDLEKIDWSGKVKIAQRNWIGRSEGALIKFEILNSKFKIEVFTTRPDTLFGATYMVLSPEHPLIRNSQFLISNFQEVANYVKKAKEKTEEERIAAGKEKTGVELKGVKAINPANKEEIPIWVADYVLSNVGTGAIMAVPAHDERDFEFAKKYHLLIRPVIRRAGISVRSVLMGFEHISKEDLVSLGIKEVKPADKMHKYIEIPEAVLPAFEQLIQEKMMPGFWNEYITHKRVIFLFKDKNGSAERLELTPETDKKINCLSAIYNNEPEPKGSVWDWLPNAPFYKELFIHTEQGALMNSAKFSGMESEKAKWEITEFVGGERKVQYRLRDWLISRQRYWGPPIPLVFCENCAVKIKNPKSKIKNNEFSKGELENPGWITVSEKDLPVKLPYLKDWRPKGKGVSPLASEPKFYKTKCPKCKGPARRETDVSDNFLDSALYFFRYLDVRNKREIFSKQIAKRWLPVDMYIGGAEHAVLHLLYVRFLTKVFKDLKLVDFDEPFKKFRAHGLIIKDGAKMSKSRGNVVTPDFYIKKFGADALRMYLMFLGPFEAGGDFRDAGILGITRFLARVRNLATSNSKFSISNDTERLLHQSIKKITEDIENLRYNTVISQLMILLNKLEESPKIPNDVYEVFLKLLAPLAPYLTEELYQKLETKDSQLKTKNDSVHLQPWPRYDEDRVKEETFSLVLQVDGKVRGIISAPVGISQADAERLALAEENVNKHLNGRKPRKVFFVPDRLINVIP